MAMTCSAWNCSWPGEPALLCRLALSASDLSAQILKDVEEYLALPRRNLIGHTGRAIMRSDSVDSQRCLERRELLPKGSLIVSSNIVSVSVSVFSYHIIDRRVGMD
jgi:hypothetical protein